MRRRSIPIVLLLLVLLGPIAFASSTIGGSAIRSSFETVAPTLLAVGLVGAAALFAVVWLWVGRYVAHTAWALTDDAVLYRSGAFGLRVSVVPLAKIQVVQRRQTFFDRRARMAKVTVDTAGASLRNHRVSIDLLDAADADRLADRLESEAARRTFRW